jgi:predicted 2-oxoglutarate/Fe(II)-dependent dioxygenase YbiX
MYEYLGISFCILGGELLIADKYTEHKPARWVGNLVVYL